MTKLTPEQAIEILDTASYGIISPHEVEMIKTLFESLSGDAAIEAADKCGRDRNNCKDDDCCFYDFCRLSAGEGGAK